MVALTPETGNRDNKAYKLFRTAVDAAVDAAGYWETNPVVIKASHRRTAPLKHKQPPTDQELLAILNNTPARYRLAIALCLFHGLRVAGVARKSWTHNRPTEELGSYFFFVFDVGDVVLEIDGTDQPESFSAGHVSTKQSSDTPATFKPDMLG